MVGFLSGIYAGGGGLKPVWGREGGGAVQA